MCKFYIKIIKYYYIILMCIILDNIVYVITFI